MVKVVAGLVDLEVSLPCLSCVTCLHLAFSLGASIPGVSSSSHDDSNYIVLGTHIYTLIYPHLLGWPISKYSHVVVRASTYMSGGEISSFIMPTVSKKLFQRRWS